MNLKADAVAKVRQIQFPVYHRRQYAFWARSPTFIFPYMGT